MTIKHDIAGKRFGRLIAIKPVSVGKSREVSWECKCDCGGTRTTRLNALIRGATKSCGCAFLEWSKSGAANRKHGLSGTPEYAALCDAIKRCEPTSKDRADYYDRGIMVCEKWRDLAKGVQDFLRHIGKRPSGGYSLDRIDNDKGYEPGNVRWATRKMQIENQRKRLRLEQFSDADILVECRRRGLSDGPRSGTEITTNE
jgi:hypothetical protein